MPRYVTSPLHFAILSALLLLAACGQSAADKVAALDLELAADDIDPALTSALEDQITVDPALTQQSNSLAVRPPLAPAQAQYPPPGGGPSVTGKAERQRKAVAAVTEGAIGCEPRFAYDSAWAKRLPPAFPLYPGAKLTDAAGTDAAGCAMRVATFTAPAAPEQVLAWYADRAKTGGYSAARQQRGTDQILAGANVDGDKAYYLIVGGRQGGGSDVALIANGG